MTYGQHLRFAWRLSARLIVAGLAAAVHGVLPCVFETTGSDAVRRLNDELAGRQKSQTDRKSA